MVFAVAFALFLAFGFTSKFTKVGAANLSYQKREYFEATQKRISKAIKVVMLIILMICLFPFGLSIYDVLTIENLPEERIKARMSDAYVVLGIMLVIWVFFCLIYIVLVRKALNHQKQIIPFLSDDDFSKYLKVNENSNILNKIIPPLVIGGNFMYLFKAGRTIEITISEIKSVDVEKNFYRGISFDVSINASKFHYFKVDQEHVINYMKTELLARNPRIHYTTKNF